MNQPIVPKRNIHKYSRSEAFIIKQKTINLTSSGDSFASSIKSYNLFQKSLYENFVPQKWVKLSQKASYIIPKSLLSQKKINSSNETTFNTIQNLSTLSNKKIIQDKKIKGQDRIPKFLNKKVSQSQAFKKFSNSSKKIEQIFIIIKKLGQGISGQVFLAMEKQTTTLYALKIISKQKIKNKQAQERVIREIKNQCFIEHRNIAKLYSFFSDRKSIYLVLQYGGEDTLYDCFVNKNKNIDKSHKISERKIPSILRQICKGVAELHHNNIIHRDLKLQNILIRDDIVKITDFGCSVSSQELRTTQIGSLPYFSPQQFTQKKYGKKKDVWSIGVIAYELLFRKTPFQQDLIAILQKKSLNEQFLSFKIPKNSYISQLALNFLQCTLNTNPIQRLDIKSLLQHKFLIL